VLFRNKVRQQQKRKDHPPRIRENVMPRVYGENGLIQNDAATDGINSVDTDEN
jgi:hypothetical protein